MLRQNEELPKHTNPLPPKVNDSVIIKRHVRFNAIIIPDNATNGDVIKLIFPDAEIQPIMGYFDKDELLGYRVYLGGRSQDYLLDWWNAPYKKEVDK